MLLAAGWFLYLGHGPTLVPWNVSWMLRDDWSAYYWGFAFFRQAPWSFPLGNTPNLIYPEGTSVAFMDANPWVALLFRAFSPLLPTAFQYAGLWFLLCYLLQAWFGTKLTGLYTQDAILRFLGGALFALTPVLPHRSAHVALSAIFFLTAGCWLYLKGAVNGREATRNIRCSWLLLAWVAGTHGYLSAMLLPLCFATYARLWLVDRVLTARAAWGAAAAAVFATLCVYLLFGYVGFKKAALGAPGFGTYSNDLTAYVNPQQWSRFFSGLPSTRHQVEGFSYLGLGVAALLPWSFVSALRTRSLGPSLRRLAPLLCVVLAMQVYAFSSRVAFLGKVVWNLDPLYAHFESLTGIFRSSGRFSWPLHLLFIAAAAAVIGVVRIRSLRLARGILLAAVLLQAAEFDASKMDFEPRPVEPFTDSAWHSVRQHYDHLEVLPVQLVRVCKADRREVDRLSQLAYEHGLTMNSGAMMRRPPRSERLCDRHLDIKAPLDPRTIYVVRSDYLGDFVGRNAVCGRLDGIVACVDGARRTPLTESLLRTPALAL